MAVDTHRAWTLDYFAEIAAEAESVDADAVARQLMLLRDGAMVNGSQGESAAVADSLAAAFASIVSPAAGASGSAAPRRS